ERSDTGALVSVGTFNCDEQGVGKLHVLLDDLPYTEYRQLIITVEPTPDADPGPSAKWSLVGRFPNTKVAPEALSQVGGGAARPDVLPVTGGAHPSYGRIMLWVGAVALVVALSAIAWYWRREVTQ
ncbi:MAG: hypothetical protein J7M34_05560, partial [Anaerolineae bacterium]|nr:hypothetical protein [Anaerolineae bacterium]